MVQIPEFFGKSYDHMREIIRVVFEDSVFVFFLDIETVRHLAVAVYRIKHEAVIAAGIETVRVILCAMLI